MASKIYELLTNPLSFPFYSLFVIIRYLLMSITLAIPVRCSTNWAMKPLTLEGGQLWVHMFPWKKWVLMIYEMNHIWTAEMKWKTHNWPAPNVSGFITQLVEHRTGNLEVTGSNSVEVLIFFLFFFSGFFFIFISFSQFIYDLFDVLTLTIFS